MNSNAAQLRGADRGEICRMREQYTPPENAVPIAIDTIL
jgi:hypothetical protein